MYVQGQGHTHYGPGTSMVQFTKPAFGMAGCGCGCGGKCGMGLFDSGADFSQWGVAEWAVIGLGAYVVLSIAGDVAGTGKKVRRSIRTRRRRAKRKTELKEELASL